MSLIRTLLARCCECSQSSPFLIQWSAPMDRKRCWVCPDCAIKFGYTEVMPSVQEIVYARPTER